MAGETLIIQELSGSRRSVELSDRSLPYRPVAWSSQHRRKKTNYAGNPVATIQMLGTEQMPLEINGKWKARYISQMATATGFFDLWSPGTAMTPTILVAIFQRLLDGGNLLEVTWAEEARKGVMVEFEAKYDSIEDIEWKVRFDWTQKGDFTAPIASPFVNFQLEFDETLLLLLDIMAQIPAFFLPNITSAILLQETLAREASLNLSASMARVSGIPTVSNAEFQAISSYAVAANTASRNLTSLALDSSIETFIATDDVNTVLAAQVWANQMGYIARILAALVIQARESVRQRVVADVLDSVRMKSNETLRTLALQYYGSADAWTTIADANGLTSSTPSVGTLIRIPRRKNTGG